LTTCNTPSRTAFSELGPASSATADAIRASVYAFYLGSLDSAAGRLRNFVQTAAQATTAGNVFDDAATGQGLLNFFLRAVNSGADQPLEAEPHTGLTCEEIRNGSFLRILEARRR